MSKSIVDQSAKRLLVVGAGGHGVVVADAAEMSGLWSKIAFVDDGYPNVPDIDQWEVVGTTQLLERYRDAYDEAIVAVGNSNVRLALLKRLESAGLPLASVIHPRACVSRLADVGGGSVVMANAVVNARARIRQGCIINTGATVDHDCRLFTGVHIAPGAHLAADVVVGEQSWIGAGASVREQVHIGKNVMVGAGAAVVNDIPDAAVVAGVPAKPLKSNEQLKAIGS